MQSHPHRYSPCTNKDIDAGFYLNRGLKNQHFTRGQWLMVAAPDTVCLSSLVRPQSK